MSKSQRREHLVDTAIDLFAERGFHATGIDTILEKSGVSKKTLYRHFRSKEELILAALRKYDGLFRNEFMRQVEARAHTPRGRILAVFDVAYSWFKHNNFFGCMFINAIGEYSENDTPIRQVCKEFKTMMRGYVRELCVRAKVDDPDGLAEKLALLLEGAIVTAQVSQTPDAAQVAKSTARVLVEQSSKSDTGGGENGSMV